MFITIPVNITAGVFGESLAKLLKIQFGRIRLPYCQIDCFKSVIGDRLHPHTHAQSRSQWGGTLKRAGTGSAVEPRAELSLSEHLVKMTSLVTRPRGGSSVSATGPWPDP